MEALDTANASNGRWKMLVTVMFLLQLWILFNRIQ